MVLYALKMRVHDVQAQYKQLVIENNRLLRLPLYNIQIEVDYILKAESLQLSLSAIFDRPPISSQCAFWTVSALI